MNTYPEMTAPILAAWGKSEIFEHQYMAKLVDELRADGEARIAELEAQRDALTEAARYAHIVLDQHWHDVAWAMIGGNEDESICDDCLDESEDGRPCTNHYWYKMTQEAIQKLTAALAL